MLLSLLIFLPLLCGGVVLALSSERAIRAVALLGSCATAVLAVAAWLAFERATDATMGAGFALIEARAWVPGTSGSGGVDVAYRVGVDGVSIWLVLLTAFLTPLAIAGSFSGIHERTKEYYAWMLVLETGMLGVFCALDLLLFYVFFEFTLIPLFFIIGIWGGPERRYASVKFFLFTVAGSVLTFAGVLLVAFYAYTRDGGAPLTFNIVELTRFAREHGGTGVFPASVQGWIFLLMAAGFAVKVPLFPVHTWLPLAHTEAPTAGSVLLAGVLLKLGTYGFFRLAIPLLPQGAVAWAPFMAALSIIGILYAALAAWVQDDVKKLVAYSSVSHLGFCMLGLFSLKLVGIGGAVAYMINHGLSTGALFLVVGCIYERYHTRSMKKIGGLARPMPIMAFFLLFFTLASIGLPGLNGFVGEFLVLLGTATSDTTLDGLPPGPLSFTHAAFAALGIILGAVYMLWMCGRVLFGPVNEPHGTPDRSHGLSRDLNRREIAILAPIAAVCLILGVYPKPMLSRVEEATAANVFLIEQSAEPNFPGTAEKHSAIPRTYVARERLPRPVLLPVTLKDEEDRG